MKAFCRAAKPWHGLRFLIIALSVVAGAEAAGPKEALVTREAQDLYRAGTGSYYLRTINCQEHIFGDRVVFRWNLGTKGGMMAFRSGRSCVIQKVLREVDPNTMQPILD